MTRIPQITDAFLIIDSYAWNTLPHFSWQSSFIYKVPILPSLLGEIYTPVFSKSVLKCVDSCFVSFIFHGSLSLDSLSWIKLMSIYKKLQL